MIGNEGGSEGRLLKAGGGDGDKEEAVTRAHERAAGARGTQAACRLQQARSGGKKDRISTSGAEEEGQEPPASFFQARRRQARDRCLAGGLLARRREGGAPPQAAPVLDRDRGTPRERCTRKRGRAQARSGLETHKVSSRAPDVDTNPG